MNLGDPELEVIDPTPDIHSLFIHFDKIFFGARLASRAVVRWSKRMYSCAGVCSYEGRGGLCDVALSEPLLKLRPRKNLVETLLHEMIHAYLFVTGNDRDRNGHGPNFQSHMYRINKAAGINITIYHDFHDEVKLYQTHVWRCNGPCVTRKPYFGIVRKSMNKAPGPLDFWWNTHMRLCGGTFTKIKEPEKPGKKPVAKKPMDDITKYVTNNKTTKTGDVTTADKMIVNSPVKQPIPVFTGQGYKLVANRSQSIDNVSETVRNVWLKKQSSIVNSTDTKVIEDVAQHVKNIWAKKQLDKNKNILQTPKSTKRTSNITPTPTPPKTKKIDDFFKSKGKAILKDLYAKDLEIPPRKTESKPNITPEVNEIADSLVNCPICSSKILNTDINSHIDECLNRKAIDKLSKTEHIIPKTLPPFKDDIERIKIEPPVTIKEEPTTTLNIPAFKPKLPTKPEFIISTITVGNLTDFIDKINNTAANDAEFQNKVQLCPCCELKIYKPMEEHMEECLAFFSNNATIPDEGASTSSHNITTIDLDDYEDDALDESLTMNATGTKCPCPVCLTMIEQNDMNNHLDTCLG